MSFSGLAGGDAQVLTFHSEAFSAGVLNITTAVSSVPEPGSRLLLL